MKRHTFKRLNEMFNMHVIQLVRLDRTITTFRVHICCAKIPYY